MPELTFRGTELRRSDIGLWFWIERGFDDEAEYRGVDVVIPGREGRYARNRKRDVRIVELQGYIKGTGVSEAAARQNYRARANDLRGLMNPTLDPGPLVAHAPLMGLTSGTATIQVRYRNAIWGPWTAGLTRKVSIELVCVENPPEWVLA